MQMRRLLLFLFFKVFCDHQFHAKKQKGKTNGKTNVLTCFYLNENIIAQNVANNVITSPFGMGEGFLNKVIITKTYEQL